MVRFLADENFNNQIVRGVLRQSPSVDMRTEEIFWYKCKSYNFFKDTEVETGHVKP
ncbi:hypothetical protein [Brasilonema sp. UFV-L1]|uniref:hypothetical protein n=1 Tax=Brasilonema sp. UFV-L1 TaxID=2234130 RepID=UPI00145F523E|nr:hypothetical protein [Brasilonema sp. UFV-L1]